MPESREKTASLRCPVCFVREVDVLLLHDIAEYYCVKCSYRGSAERVRADHQASKRKFRNIATRFTIDDLESI